MAWQCISPELSVKGLKNCCISKAENKTDYDILWNGNEEGGSVRSECEEDKGADHEDRNSNKLAKRDRI